MQHIFWPGGNVICSILPESHLAVISKRLSNFLAPVHNKLAIAANVVGFHEGLDGRYLIPAAGEDLIATQMDEVRIPEQNIDFLEHIHNEVINSVL